MANEKDQLTPEELPFDLESEIGEISGVQRFIPGVYYLTTQKEDCPAENYYVVMEFAAVFAAVSGYGRQFPGLRLYPVSEATSGWRIAEYELAKYQMTRNPELLSEEAEQEFHRTALFAAGYHPEYFGEYPVPIRHRKLENGVYWLETSRCEELLAVCYPIWNTEFTSIARVIGEPTEYDSIQGYDKTMGYLFFSQKSCCVAFYELMQTRPAWEGTVIDKTAVMNAIWRYLPKYAAMAPRTERKQLEELSFQNQDGAGARGADVPGGGRRFPAVSEGTVVRLHFRGPSCIMPCRRDGNCR